MKIDGQSEKEKKDSFEMSERYKLGRALVADMRKSGGFTKKQAIYLINWLNDFLPIY